MLVPFFPHLESKKILLITEVTYGLGDFFAAKKAIALLGQQSPHLSIHWLIRSAKNVKDLHIKIAQLNTVFSENVIIELVDINQHITINSYNDINVVVFFPTIHYLDAHQFQLLKSLGVPMLQIHEYDFIPLLHKLVNKDELPAVTTGFDGLGLFLDDMNVQPVVALDSILPAPFSFNSQNELFFSYISHEDHHVINHADFTNFAKIALKIASPEKSVDIIANSNGTSLDSSFKNYAWEHGFSEILWFERDKDNQIIQRISTSPRLFTSTRQLRIMNPFPLTPQQMQALIVYAHPLQQCTGDQSLSEMFSVGSLGQGIFPFYQIMYWKRETYKNWSETAQSLLGKHSAYVTLLQSIGNGKALDIMEFTHTWKEHQETILADSIKLYNHLIKEKNLYANVTQYLDLFLYIYEQLPRQQFKNNAALLVQLLIKLHDPSSIISVLITLNSNEDLEQTSSIIHALTDFLKMNPVDFDARQIHVLIDQLLQTSIKERLFTARTSRQLLITMPTSLRHSWVERLIPLLQHVASSLHQQILNEVANLENPEAILQQTDGLSRLIERHLLSEKNRKVSPHYQNKMLLAVHVFDGTGDIAKYIATYHHLKCSFPHTTIITLIQIEDRRVSSLLAMLRQNVIPLKNVYIWSLPILENFQQHCGLMSEQSIKKQFQQIGFNYTEHFSLIISLATPFDAIRIIRKENGFQTPYIEIAEINYCSHHKHRDSFFPQDANHQLVAMGLSDDAIGLEITRLSESSPASLLAQLTPSLANNLLDGEPDSERVNHFLNRTFFMPSYLKGDEGALSLHFPLALLETYFKDKETLVIWVHELPFAVTSPAFQSVLKARGISSMIVYDNQNRRHQYSIKDASGCKELRIVCGVVSMEHFDLMYQIAQYTGGFAGCVGQNSFEKALSFNLIPVFYAPPWQLSIIYQCQGLIASLFPVHLPEHHCVNEYLSSLATLSSTRNITTALLKTKHFQPHVQWLQTLAPRDFQNELIRIGQEDATTIETSALLIDKLHPLEIVQALSHREDIKLLQSAWQQVCTHIRQKKNFNAWLVAEAGNFLPTLAALPQHQECYDTQKAQALFSSQHHLELSIERFPKTKSFLTALLNEIWPTHETQGLQLILNNCNRYLVKTISGLGYPCFGISQKAFAILSDGELHFILRLLAEQSKNYPVENVNFDIKNIEMEQLWPAFTKELQYGIHYCRKQVEWLQEECEKFNQPTFFNDEHRGLEQDRNFYQNMIKSIELHLANRHKQELNRQQLFINEQDVLRDCRIEIDQETAFWRTTEPIASTVDSLNHLLETLPQLHIKTCVEHDFPTIATQQFLNEMRRLQIDAKDSLQCKLALHLIKQAYHHRVACFDAIYLFISEQLVSRDTILMFGPFAKLRDLIHTFLNATSFAKALDKAQKIERFLHAEETRHLFINSTLPVTTNDWYRISGNKVPVNAFICSTIGARIQWVSQTQLPIAGTKHCEQFISWCEEDNTRIIPMVLFRLGMISERRIWNYISSEDAGRFCFSFLNGILLGEIPAEYCSAPSSSMFSNDREARPTLQLKFLFDYFKHQYDVPPINPDTSTPSREKIETFIKQNSKPLSLQGITNKSSQRLIELFDEFLISSPEEAQMLIHQFYLDPDYLFGLHQLYTLRRTVLNVPILNNKFDAHQTKNDWQDEALNIQNTEKKSPYIYFLLKHKPKYLPLNDLLEVLTDKFHLSFSTWPIDYFFAVLQLRIDKLEDVHQAINTLKKYCISANTDTAQDFIHEAIANIYKDAAKHTQDISLFAEATCRFITDADLNNVQMRKFCQNICNRADFATHLNTYSGTSDVSVVLLSSVYKRFDRLISWPNNQIRNLFSKVLLQELAKANPEQQVQAAEILLFDFFPLTDVAIINPLINYWVSFQFNQNGKDDKSYSYYLTCSRLCQKIIEKVPGIYNKQMLENFLTQIEAQDQLAEFVERMLNSSSQSSIHNIINTEHLLTKIANKLAIEKLSMQFVKFLSYELTSASLNQFISCLNNKQYQILKGNLLQDDLTSSQEASFMAIMIYQIFWNHSLEERAVVLNHLMMPSSSIRSEQEAEQAYQQAFNFVCSILFQESNNENKMSKAFLNSYLNVSNPFVKPYLLAAIISANKMTEGPNKNLATTLPKLAEAMGAAGVKSGQAAHSYPRTPQNLRDGLASLKSQSRLPYRWELWKLLKATVPDTLLQEIKLVKKLLGGASFYVAVEVEMKNDDTAVLRLLRSKAKEEAQYGFAHLKAALEDCQHPQIKSIYGDLAHLIHEAKAGAKIEIDHQFVGKQYEIAATIYQHPAQTVKIGHQIFHIKIRPVRLFSHGAGYQFISIAEGIEFNELKKEPHNLALCQAIALVVCKTELANMLGDGPCDFDRHGAQARITCYELASGEFEVLVTNYDFGEISPIPATKAQLTHCHNFINNTAANLFSKWNLLKSYATGLSGASLMEQFATQMIDYIRSNSSVNSLEPKIKGREDLSRLRGIFKGLLALNDFLEILSTNERLIIQLKDVLDKYTTPTSSSVINSLFGLFSNVIDQSNASSSSETPKLVVDSTAFSGLNSRTP